MDSPIVNLSARAAYKSEGGLLTARRVIYHVVLSVAVIMALVSLDGMAASVPSEPTIVIKMLDMPPSFQPIEYLSKSAVPSNGRMSAPPSIMQPVTGLRPLTPLTLQIRRALNRLILTSHGSAKVLLTLSQYQIPTSTYALRMKCPE